MFRRARATRSTPARARCRSSAWWRASSARNEPITYWITVGDKAVMSGIDQKLRRCAYGLSGTDPGRHAGAGVDHRSPTSRGAYRVQDRFIGQMLGVLARARPRAPDRAPARR